MLLLAIDPGIERTGYALVEQNGHSLRAVEYGCIQTSSKKPLEERLLELKKDITQLVASHKPQAAAIERLVFVHNATSALAVGQARGVVLLTLHEAGLSVSEYSPAEVKRAVTMSGDADKQSVGRAVKIVFQLTEIPQPDDAADALALAVCHASQVQ